MRIDISCFSNAIYAKTGFYLCLLILKQVDKKDFTLKGKLKPGIELLFSSLILLQLSVACEPPSCLVVCNSFSNAIELSNHRRANEHRSGRVRFSNSKVTINCMSQGCTEALCHINIQTPSNDVKTESEVSTDERYDLYVQFAIPVCHQHIIVYKVYNETTNQKQTILQEGVISSIEGSHYHPVTGKENLRGLQH